MNCKKVKSEKLATYYELLIPDSIFTVGQEIKYFDKNGNDVKSLKYADSYSIVLRELALPDRKVELQFSMKGKLKFEKHLIDVPDENNKIISILDGKLKEWFDNGQLRQVIEYKNDKYDGKLFTYWINGKIKRDDNFEGGKSVNGKCFNIDGNEIKYFSYEIMPQFPGGLVVLLRYISKTLNYPEDMWKRGIQGDVIVQFIVDKDGKISNVEVTRGVSPTLDSEAIRVVKSLPNWTPGMKDGEIVSVRYSIPITFNLK